ncbi:MAG: bifunctional histidinol-phosphatase/imidazoleglycerol-phosphate dehydratase HisB [Oligoflexus sp.]
MKKILFIDRDGTICEEPEDFQVDRIEKIKLLPGVIPALLSLQKQGYQLIMVSNQDGLGTERFPEEDFTTTHEFLMSLLETQGIRFADVLICPHFPDDHCFCRKPNLGLVVNYLNDPQWSRQESYVIGDRDTDIQLAERMGITGLRVAVQAQAGDSYSWNEIVSKLVTKPRTASVTRNTNETKITVSVNLDEPGTMQIATGIGFFDHMLEQLAKHGGFSLELSCDGDLHIDDHHSIEDIGLALGEALRLALGDKYGIARYGFLLPMDESEAQVQVSLDLSGRPYFVLDGAFARAQIGQLATEMIPHFFRSLAESLKANLHIRFRGDNDHHKAEAIFKAVARSLRQAIKKYPADEGLPSTKGML